MRNQRGPSWFTLAVMIVFFIWLFNALSSITTSLVGIAVMFIFFALGASVLSRVFSAMGQGNTADQRRTPPRTAQRQQPDWQIDWQPRPAPMQRTATPQQIADRALHNAGNAPVRRGIRLVDIGVLAYDGNQRPVIHRDAPISATATHIRPYIVLDLPFTQAGRGRIMFELLDEHEQVRFASDHRYTVSPGQNFVTPSTWLPMNEREVGGNWALRVSIGDQVLALHHVRVSPDAGTSFRPYLREDGEIDEWLLKAAKDNLADDQMSLDQLLQDQDDIEIDMFRDAQRAQPRQRAQR
jgi:hypothetical protein